MTLTREERETIVRTSDADEGWIISTASPKYIRKFTKLGYRQSSSTSGLDGYRDFTVPRNLVSFRRQEHISLYLSRFTGFTSWPLGGTSLALGEQGTYIVRGPGL